MLFVTSAHVVLLKQALNHSFADEWRVAPIHLLEALDILWPILCTSDSSFLIAWSILDSSGLDSIAAPLIAMRRFKVGSMTSLVEGTRMSSHTHNGGSYRDLE